MKNPYIIIHGMHRNTESDELEADWEVVVPRGSGSTTWRGTTGIGRRIEIEVEELSDKKTKNDED